MNQQPVLQLKEFLERAQQAVARISLNQRVEAITAAVTANPQVSQKQLFGGLSDDQWRWISTEGVESVEALTRCLPPLPSKEVQLRFTGDSGREHLQRAFAVYLRLKELCRTYGVPLDRVLEFGCGWGRILRCFVRDLDPENVCGVDVHPEMVGLCNSGKVWGRITRSSPRPPSNFPARSLNLIYAYSVFTHLSEDAHLAWLAEFSGLLREGGLLVLTTRPRGFIEMCARYTASKDTSPWMRGLREAFPDPLKTLAEYDQGRFIFAPVGGGDFLPGEFYGETCIPLDYVRRVWGQWFDLLESFEADDYQVFLVLRPKTGSK